MKFLQEMWHLFIGSWPQHQHQQSIPSQYQIFYSSPQRTEACPQSVRHIYGWVLSPPRPRPRLCQHVVLKTKAIRRFVITEKAPTRAFSWLKAATTTFTFKTLWRHYAKRALTPRSLNVKLGPRRNYHKGRAAIRHYANQPARPLWPLRRGPNFTLRDRGVYARLA